MRKKIVTFANYVSGKGCPKDSEPCENFDDCPIYTTPEEMVTKLLAGGQVQDFAQRKVFYDKEEFEAYKDEYACDYVQRYKDLMSTKAMRYGKSVDDTIGSSDSSASKEESKETPLKETLSKETPQKEVSQKETSK